MRGRSCAAALRRPVLPPAATLAADRTSPPATSTSRRCPRRAGRAPPRTASARRRPLPAVRGRPKLRSQGGADAAALEAVATSSDFGAPQASRRQRPIEERGREPTRLPQDDRGSLGRDASGAGRRRRHAWLVLALARDHRADGRSGRLSAPQGQQQLLSRAPRRTGRAIRRAAPRPRRARARARLSPRWHGPLALDARGRRRHVPARLQRRHLPADGPPAVAIAAWWAIAIGVVLRPGRAGARRARRWSAGGALAAFAASDAALDRLGGLGREGLPRVHRVLMYLGVLCWSCSRSRAARAASVGDGVAAGIVAVTLLALASRLFFGDVGPGAPPSFFPVRTACTIRSTTGTASRSSSASPSHCCCGPPSAERPALLRALALVPVPAMAAAIYLTSSRGGASTAAVGVLVFCALTSRRLSALVATGIAGGRRVCSRSRACWPATRSWTARSARRRPPARGRAPRC